MVFYMTLKLVILGSGRIYLGDTQIQIHLLTTEKERINTNIHHNTIIVNSSKIETFLNFVFDNLYTPQNPVNILMK